MLIVHPLTRETWDITPLLNVMPQLGAANPAQMAEAIYDISRYIIAEQHSSSDTAARLRLMVGRLEKLAVAFDSIQVEPSLVGNPPLRIIPD